MTPKILCILTMLLFSTSVKATEIDQQHQIESKALNESRDIWVSLPASYTRNESTYPVLYVLDAQSHFTITSQLATHLARAERIPELIVVGIPLLESIHLVRDRIRDYSPTHVKVEGNATMGKPWQHSGRAHVFRQFIFDEVMPLIKSSYRTEPFNILAGHSQGGLFATDTLLKANHQNSHKIQSYIAASPSFWWDNQVMVGKVTDWLSKPQASATYYFSLASGDKHTSKDPIIKVHDLLNYQSPTALNWKYDYFANETHSSMVLKSYYEGLMFTFKNFAIPEAIRTAGIDAIKSHYQRLTKTLGYTLKPTEKRVNGLGYERMYKGDLDSALAFFHWNVEQYPQSANAQDSLAEGYFNTGEKNKAIKHYQLSLALNPKNSNAAKMLKKLKN